MTDFRMPIHKLAPGSDVPYIYPNVSYQIVNAGTSTIVAEGTTDAEGNIKVTTLPSGHYDIKIGSTIVHSFHHITNDFATKYPETLIWHQAGTISADADESPSLPVYAPGVDGKIISLNINIEHIDATGDITIHLLRGDSGGSSALTVASNSVGQGWRHYPQEEKYRYSPYGRIIPSPDILLLSDQTITIGLDYTAGTIEGLTVKAVFKPT